MKNKNGPLPLRFAPSKAGFALATLLPLAIGSASAFELKFGPVSGSLDTTLSYGTGWRVEAQDPALAALYPDYPTAVLANRRTFLNKNDGNANFDNDLTPITSVYKITSDLELKAGDYGLFVRGTAFYDSVIMDERPNRSTPNFYPNSASCNAQNTVPATGCGFPSEISDHSGSNARFLDAYVYGNFVVGDRALNVRLGEQVINWGEALFIQDGINNANPVSLSKLRLPGAEVREALLPLPMIYASYELADSLTMEAFYEFDWDYSEPDDVGTYYSTDDAFAGNGANRILVDLQNAGACASLCLLAQSYNLAVNGTTSTVLTADRIADKPVNNDGQFGIAFRYNMDATEFGLFYMNYHSRKPVAQSTTATYNAANPLAAAAFIDNTTYQLVYPEDIQMFGLSFSTTLGSVSVSGEVAYRPNDIILSELGDNLVAYNTIAAACYASGVCDPATGFSYGQVLNNGNPVPAGTTVKVWEEVESFNFDFVVINNFGPLVGADGVTGVLEFGASYVPAAEDKRYASTAALLNIPLADVPAPLRPAICAPAALLAEAGTCLSEGPSNDYMDSFSWGYRAVLTANYSDVLAGISLNPVLRFAHDVDGNSHRTGNFLENRKSGTLALNALYNQKLEAGVAYNAFWGAKSSNLLGDRDNLTLTVKYSF
ncbi:MAG: DUF1302 domain-containing protein [Moraxellaceae bacterium]|nr:DUF1302 domain-containing protein [Moraxellaceae bacterium]